MYFEYELNKQHREKLLREVEANRLAKPSSRAQAAQSSLVLAALGRHMVRLGERLQQA